MREILFRGKRVDNGEWIKGFYCQVADESDGGARIKQTILVPTFLCQSGFKQLEVDSETVGQYTGLTDKNGKKIFEGDIILVDFDGFPIYKREISFNQDVSAYVLWNGTKSKFYPMSEAPKKYSKVIGNIYDNPELLGGDDN